MKQLELLGKYYGPRALKSLQWSHHLLPSSLDKVQVPPEHFPQQQEEEEESGGVPASHTNWLSSRETLVQKLSQYPDELKMLSAATGKQSPLQELATKISLQTGVSSSYVKDKLEMQPLVLKTLSSQTSKGKIRTFYALCCVGDKQGMVGLGEGKSRDSMIKAIRKAHWESVQNLHYIPLLEQRTVPMDQEYRYHGVKLHLRRREHGFGVRVHHTLFTMCELVGIKDLSVKVYQSRNNMNVAKGFLEALCNYSSLPQIALQRGKKIVDIQKVYYSE